jgi:hypothetical protein
MAMETILSDLSVSMTEFKKNPNEALRESGGRAVVRVAKERLKQKDRAIELTLDDL